MQYYAELVYGFDFSDNNYPKSKFELVEEIVEELESQDLFSSVYSGYGDSLIYLGVKLGSFNDGDCMFKTCNRVNKKLDDNTQLYKDKVNEKIDSIINWLNMTGMSKAKDGEFVLVDVQSAIDYFNNLKTKTPKKLTISGTD